MSVERLTAADASNVVMDAHDQVNVFLLAGLLGPGGFVGADGSADLDELRSAVAARLDQDPALRRFSQRVTSVRHRLTWTSCPPDLQHHVRQVPAVSGQAGLGALAARLMTAPVPKDRPLWELLIVPGAGPSGPGLILRVHHAMADGVAGVRLVQRLFGVESDPAAAASGTATQTARPPVKRFRLHNLVVAIRRATSVFGTGVGPTPLLGPIGSHRGVAFVDVDLADFAAGARRAGGTVNDALLSAVTGALATTLAAAGEAVPDFLPASVPVALPDRGDSGNATGVMLVQLPLSQSKSATRIVTIAQNTQSAKAEARRLGTFELTRTRWTSKLFALLARRQRFIALFVTNVRGPGESLRVAGAPLERVWPLAQIYGNVRLGIAAFSYAGRLSCAVHLDADALDADVLGRALQTQLADIAGQLGS